MCKLYIGICRLAWSAFTLPKYDRKSGCIPKYADTYITLIQMHPIVVSTDWYGAQL